MKAGAAVVPMAPYPTSRAAKILGDIHAPLILSSSDRETDLQNHGYAVHVVDRDLLESCPSTDADLDVQVDESDLCYVVYTSGSTG